MLCGIGNTVYLSDLASGRLVHTLKGHEAPVTALAGDRAGRRAISGHESGKLCVWDLERGSCLGVLTAHRRAPIGGETDYLDYVTYTHVTPDGARAISATYSHYDGASTLRLWDMATGACASFDDYDLSLIHI